MEAPKAEENRLICNFNECYKEIRKIGYVTICSHIFCEDHGKTLISEWRESDKVCPACKQKFESHHQIFQTNLEISSNMKKLILAGHNPRDIIDIARSGISFWEYQRRSENSNLKRKLEYYRKKMQDLQKHKLEVVKENSAKIEALSLENQKLKKEVHDLNIELVSTSEKLYQYDQKSKKMKPNFP